MISKVLRQNDLYHNPDPLGRLVGEANESNVIVEGWKLGLYWILALSYWPFHGHG